MVDAGCGDAPFATTAQQHCDRYIATDVVAGPRVDIVSTIDSLPFGGESIDTVLCSQVLEHVGSPADAIAELSRILRPGGILIASMPQYSPNHEEPFDFGRFTIHGIRRLTESNGLAIVEHHRVGGSFSVVGLASNYAICELVQRSVPVRWKRVATGLFIPFFLVTNITAYLLDALIPLESDSVNHLVVAAKEKASTLRSETSNAVP